jgi:hypothetical protein
MFCTPETHIAKRAAVKTLHLGLAVYGLEAGVLKIS